MPISIKATVSVQVPGVGTMSDTHTLEPVEAIDKIEVDVPKAADGGAAEVEVQPGGAGQVHLLLITADTYSDQLSYTVDGGAADVVLDGPQLMVGAGAVSLLGPVQQKITFSNAASDAVKVQIVVGRDATP